MENPSKTQKHAVRVLTESGRVVCVKSGKTNGSVKRRVCHSSASIENFFNGPVNQTKSPSAFDLEKRRHLKLIIWERPCKNPACGNDAWPDGDGHCQKCHHDIVTARKKVKSKMAKIKDEITKVLLGQEQHIDITM